MAKNFYDTLPLNLSYEKSNLSPLKVLLWHYQVGYYFVPYSNSEEKLKNERNAFIFVLLNFHRKIYISTIGHCGFF